MQISKNHHYVPEAITKNFCISGKTTLYTSRAYENRKIEKRNISSIFKRRHYNSYIRKDGSKDDSLERFFGKEFDDYIPNWIEKFSLVFSGDRSYLFDDEHDRRRFIQFFYNHHRRSPDFMEPILEDTVGETFHENFIEEFEERYRPLTADEKYHLNDPVFQALVAGNSRVSNVNKQTVHILETMAKLSVVIATPSRPNKQFIVASNPVVRFEDKIRQPLGEGGVELWTTLTPKIAVGLAKVEDRTGVLSLPDRETRKLNLQLAKHSQSFAGTSEKLLLSLAKAAWPKKPRDTRPN